MKYLACGEYANVYACTLDGVPVVAKILKEHYVNDPAAVRDLQTECTLLCNIDHGNVVRLQAVGEEPAKFLVLEKLSGGTLEKALNIQPVETDTFLAKQSRAKKWPMHVAIATAGQLAQGLRHCHGGAMPGRMVLHRDIKPSNIGFGANGEAKLLDFGLAKLVAAGGGADEVFQMTGNTGSLRYMAPEVACNMPYNEKADIYSFSILLWEMLARKKPFEGLNPQTFADKVVNQMHRPPISDSWPKPLAELLRSCWAHRIADRPSFDEVCYKLDLIAADLENELAESQAMKAEKQSSRMSLRRRMSLWQPVRQRLARLAEQ